MKINRRIVIPAVAGVAVLGVAGGAWAITSDRGDRETETRGACAAASYELSAEREDGGLEVSLEVQSTAPGESWDVSLEHNDQVLVTGKRLTDEDAEVDVDAFVRRDSEHHIFKARFTGPDGKQCVATLRR